MPNRRSLLGGLSAGLAAAGAGCLRVVGRVADDVADDVDEEALGADTPETLDEEVGDGTPDGTATAEGTAGSAGAGTPARAGTPVPGTVDDVAVVPGPGGDPSRTVVVYVRVLEGGAPLANEPVLLRDSGGTLDERSGRTAANGWIVFVEGVGPSPCNPMEVELPEVGAVVDAGCWNTGVLEVRVNPSGASSIEEVAAEASRAYVEAPREHLRS